MPRQRGPARSAPSRPTAPSSAPRSVAPQQQHRPMSTAAPVHAPGQQQAAHPPPAQASQGPGLFGQMASTAAGVAVGSSIGHAIGGFFGGGGSSAAPVEQQQQLPTDAYSRTGQAMDNALYTQSSSSAEASGPCATDIKSFTDCMNQNRGDLNICGWYLEQLKACQQAARQY